MQTPIGALLLAALAGIVVDTAAAQTVHARIVGQVANLAPAPPAGPFAGAQIGDAVTLELTLAYPGSHHTFHDEITYAVLPTMSTLQVGAASDTFHPTSPVNIGVWNDYLGARDWFEMFNEPLAQGGLVRLDLVDAASVVFDTPDIVLLRGTYPASSFTTINFGAQVGGGFLDFSVTELVLGNAGIGDVYCAPAVPNSTGYAALMQIVGSDVLAANQMTLEARRMPANTFGFFLTSSAQALVLNPGGSQGTLCLGGAIGRYQNQVQSSGTAGAISLAVTPQALPQPTGAVSAQVGETWNFQAWYRDANPTSTSNFTDAVAVTLQ